MTYVKLGFAGVLALMAGVAQADEFEAYGTTEGWNVYVDTSKNSCFVEAVDESENVVQMGLTTDRGVGYVGAFTKAETDIKKDETKAVAILIGDDIYTGDATGMRGNITKGYSGGYVLSDDPKFFEDIAKQYTMTVFPEKKYAFVVNLKGTYKALEMAKECNQKLVQ
ncbi:hypothetical protein [Ruegeria hyattellae]|uniref:hypothetical protein n=1 Tax=Ruegeria hyattellae TaxID=3233337 RepID=UPI00355AF90A